MADNAPVFDFRVNVVSVANLLALLGVLYTAISSYTGLTARVDRAQADIGSIVDQLQRSVQTREAETNALKAKDEFIVKTISDIQNQNIERTVRVETELKALSGSVNKVETTLQRWMERQIRSTQPP